MRGGEGRVGKGSGIDFVSACRFCFALAKFAVCCLLLATS